MYSLVINISKLKYFVESENTRSTVVIHFAIFHNCPPNPRLLSHASTASNGDTVLKYSYSPYGTQHRKMSTKYIGILNVAFLRNLNEEFN